ncbi:hypothetical protein [Actinosynnema sp. NPDC023587]|uniref:tetratricopeptide repeat protein n=1 Tax=Actinosynnema sp. NPDC023587 TaxID=3154695 RepID=UPI00340AE147
MTDQIPERILSAARIAMTEGAVVDAEKLLTHLWLTLPDGADPPYLDELKSTSVELADRFPLEDSTSNLMYCATVAYAKAGAFLAATGTAERMLSVWRARCQRKPTADTLCHHAHALDTVAGTYQARGMSAAVRGLLVELAEWHFTSGNDVGFAWALRELGALALLAGDWDNAAKKFHSAQRIYDDEAHDPAVAQERAECQVLSGRLAYATGDVDSARQWFGQALENLSGEAVEEVHALLRAAGSGEPLPELEVLRVGVFGRPIREIAESLMPPPLTAEV